MHCQIMDGGHLAVKAYASECNAVCEISKDRADFTLKKMFVYFLNNIDMLGELG